MPYEKTCSICNKPFTTIYKAKNMCSKECRQKSMTHRKIYSFTKCIVCDWDITIELHHENGHVYPLCPNHHSLISRNKQTLDDVLKGVKYDPALSMRSISVSCDKLLKTIIKNEVKLFTYKDIMDMMGWEYALSKKCVLELMQQKIVVPKNDPRGGYRKTQIYETV